MKICETPDCDNITEGKTSFCASCNSLHRKIAKQRVKDRQKFEASISRLKQPRKKPKKVSEKRKTENEQYWLLRDEFLKEHPDCQAKTETCTKESTDVHHMIGRGKEYLNTKFWLSVCRNCHIFITDNPVEAIKRNFSYSRLEKRDTV